MESNIITTTKNDQYNYEVVSVFGDGELEFNGTGFYTQNDLVKGLNGSVTPSDKSFNTWISYSEGVDNIEQFNIGGAPREHVNDIYNLIYMTAENIRNKYSEKSKL